MYWKTLTDIFNKHEGIYQEQGQGYKATEHQALWHQAF